MANITISELRPAGTELFLDSESFINELTNEELNLNKGGLTILPSIIIYITPGYAPYTYINSR